MERAACGPPFSAVRPIRAVMRPISEIRAELTAADRRHDFRAVLRLEEELRKAADQATHLTGGKRGD